MAVLGIEQVAPALKQLVANDVVKLFEQSAKLYNTIKKATAGEFVNGKGFRKPVYLEVPTGHTWFSRSAPSFNTPNGFTYKDMYVFPVNYGLAMDFDGQAIRNFKDESSMVRWLGDVLKHYTETAIKELEEQICGDGSGAKAFVGAGSAGTNLVLRTTPAATFGQTKGGVYLQKNGVYDIINPSTGAVRGQVTVTAKGTSSVTVNALPGGTADGDPVVHTGGYNRAIRGLAHLINNGTDVLQFLSRADYAELRSPVTDLAGAALGPATISKTKAFLQYRAGDENGGSGLTAFIGHGQWENLRRQGYNLKRFMGDDAVSGVSGKYVDGDTTFIPATNVDEDRVYFVDLSDLERYEEKPLGLFNEDGLTIRQKPGTNGVGSDAYYANMGVIFNLGIGAPHKHALIKRASITDLATQVGAFS